MKQFKSQAEIDEYHNQMRAERGLAPLPDGYHITQIVEGMTAGCGCQVTNVRPGSHFTIYHHGDCRNSHPYHREVVQCTPEGQAVCSTPDPHTRAVMRLDLPWPHELLSTSRVEA